MNENKEEVILNNIDSGWKSKLPVKLITYPDGSIDIHRQTGPDFDKDMELASKILEKRGLRIDKSKGMFIGPTGAYQDVVPMEES